MKLSRGQRRARVALKRFVYSQLYGRDALRMMFGRARPLVPFVVEATPPSVYWNFEIRPERVAGLRAVLDLPFPLAPIRCLEGDEPFYCLTLNMYRVSGLVSQIRAEWSLYIEDAGGTPRYLVLEPQADSTSLDPVNLFTRSGDVRHAQNDDGSIESRVVDASGGCFTSHLNGAAGGTPVRVAPDWVKANDYIYWLCGICDRTFYDSGLASPPARLVSNGQAKLADTTRWSELVVPEPRHIVVYEDAIEFAMSPWWNLDDMRD